MQTISKGHVIRKYRKVINSHIDSFIIKHSKFCIISVYNIVNLITAAALYFLIPILMGYGANVCEISKTVGSSYNTQFIIGCLIAIIIGTIVFEILFKDIDNWSKLLLTKKVDLEKVKEIRKKSINLPYQVFIYQMIIMTFSTALVSIAVRIIINFPMIPIFKINIIVVSFSFFSAVVSYTFAKKIFSRILFDTYLDSCLDGIRVVLKTKMCLQIIPMIIATSLLMALLAYSQVIEEKGDVLFESYKLQLQEKLTDLNDIKDSKMLLNTLTFIKLKGIKTTYFVVSPEGNIITSDDSVNSPTFIYTINNPVDGNRVYGNTNEIQGVIQKVEINDQYFVAGVKFEVVSEKTVNVFLVALICLLLVNALVVYFFSKSISNDISQVVNSLLEIPEGAVNKSRMEIPVISNDEIGDLVIAFNRLQQYEKKCDGIKNDFFANVSHEFRTPLNIILASVQLSNNLEKNEDVYYNKNDIDKKLEIIKKNSYRLLRIINNLIDVSKITTSFYDINMTNNNIVNIVEDISLSVIGYLKEREINILFDTSIEERIIACDVDIIERIMLNLLSNSVKFTNPGGSIFIKMYEDGENVIISVKDTGIGIEPEDHKMIFEHFKQVDSSINRKSEGSGIGLYLAKLLVEMHKGSIDVKSELGVGTEFVITLPIIVLDGQQNISCLEKQITSQKVVNSIDKTEIEFSDIYYF
ncbi:MAG TPA: HAMP domain-containing sensor histidine kinase [Ruminiclostridium sp.]